MAAQLNRAVFLDRDGVLTVPEFRNGRSYAAQSLETFHFYPDAADGVKSLKEAGFIIVVVTNQPDVGAGLVERSLIDTMHERLRAAMPVDDVEVAIETRAQAQGLATDRRKPGIGMLMSAAKRWNLDLNSSYMVGDRASDIEAGLAAGCTSVFIDLGYTNELVATGQAATVSSVSEAAAWIVADASK
ncbi:MAG: HAD-IIIA family hydrolase [Rhizobiales bacterium]|nr:HAD-IIIA family hydrolase [Hyphomicrobiales bacterium]